MIHSRLHRFVNQRKIILPKTKKLQVRSLPEHLYNRARNPSLHYFSYEHPYFSDILLIKKIILFSRYSSYVYFTIKHYHNTARNSILYRHSCLSYGFILTKYFEIFYINKSKNTLVYQFSLL